MSRRDKDEVIYSSLRDNLTPVHHAVMAGGTKWRCLSLLTRRTEWCCSTSWRDGRTTWSRPLGETGETAWFHPHGETAWFAFMTRQTERCCLALMVRWCGFTLMEIQTRQRGFSDRRTEWSRPHGEMERRLDGHTTIRTDDVVSPSRQDGKTSGLALSARWTYAMVSPLWWDGSIETSSRFDVRSKVVR